MLLFDPKSCTGCCACQMACMDQRDIRPDRGEQSLCRIVPWEGHGRLEYRFVHCIHCGKCAEVCPTGCLHREDGLILAEESLCIGCRACEGACPVGVITFDADTGMMKKCDGCWGRVQAGLPPACVHTCPTGALQEKRRENHEI